jgi:lysophospholipase L1-like esterase
MAVYGLSASTSSAGWSNGSRIGGPMVVLIGASYARGWEVPEIEGRAVLNKGVDGEQTQDMLARFERDVIGENPAAVIIWGFISNLFRSNGADMAPAMQRARSDIEVMVSHAEERGITAILATEVTITNPDSLKERIFAKVGPWFGKESYQDRINERVHAVNHWIREFAEQKYLKLLDFERVLSDERGWRIRDYAAEDGSHISPAGYKALSDYVESVNVRRVKQ